MVSDDNRQTRVGDPEGVDPRGEHWTGAGDVGHEKLRLLNIGDEMATVNVTRYYADGNEAGPCPLSVAPERVHHVRINDLIDPYDPR